MRQNQEKKQKKGGNLNENENILFLSFFFCVCLFRHRHNTRIVNAFLLICYPFVPFFDVGTYSQLNTGQKKSLFHSNLYEKGVQKRSQVRQTNTLNDITCDQEYEHKKISKTRI